jgi:asparagine synthase (glutamine-hydrolysing)
MCGMCGVWRLDRATVEPADAFAMRDSMRHRGPDGAACAFFDTGLSAHPVLLEQLPREPRIPSAGSKSDLVLGHRRLAIIDLATGDQPMCNEDGSIWLVYNGEIYNYRELRRLLSSHGHVFRTESDSEVILHAYEQYGEECPAYFNGIFAFAIWDARRERLFLARDHFGVKPLYYHHREGKSFSFASEIKALLADPEVPREMDVEALNLCLTFRRTPSPWTLFRGIRKLSPASSLSVSRTDLREHTYWSGDPPIDRTTEQEAWIEQLQQSLQSAVTRQMISDVPLGLSLSSGVDSTTILALMRKSSTEAVKAFTVGFEGSDATSEVASARGIAKRFGAEFHERVLTADDYGRFMDRYVWHLEEPVSNQSAAAYYFVADMAKRHGMKVLLNGQGPDEAFAGYGRHLATAYWRWLRVGTRLPGQPLIRRALAGTSIGEQYERFVLATEASDEEDRFLSTYAILSSLAKERLLDGGVKCEMDHDLPRRYVTSWLERAPHGTALERMTWVDTRTSLPDDLLLCEDKMAMAAGVEARVPFLDVEFMRVAERIPGAFKIRLGRGKYIHRKVASALVGPTIASGRKIGFESAMDVWLKGALGERLRDALETPSSFTASYLDRCHVSHLLEEHLSGTRDHQRILFLLLSLESWHSRFVLR